MDIAFTFNQKRSDAEQEAEFDTPETIAAIADGLRAAGHGVELVEVSGPPSQAIARLEALHPDLVFNTAEGRFGRYREAFYPGLFEQLGLPFTGSDAFVCTLTLDKNLTKRVVADAGVPVPKSVFAQAPGDAHNWSGSFPVILKPNYEGSSKGITQDSVVEALPALRKRLAEMLISYPEGILVEEFVQGIDVAVPFIDGVSPKTGGVLPAIEYIYGEAARKGRKYAIYDYDLKNKNSDWVDVRVPARLPAPVLAELQRLSNVAFAALGVRDFGRIDFRVAPDGRVVFIEANALPSLEPGAGIYGSAALAGLASPSDVLEAIVESACKRSGIQPRMRPSRSRKRLRVGFTYNEKRVTPGTEPGSDVEVEFDSPKTLNAVREAIRSHGHEVIDLEATPELPVRLAAADVDLVFNIAEGIRGRNRESQVPALLDLMQIPYTGSDSTALALTLDKGLAKRIVREEGVITPKWLLLVRGTEKMPDDMSFPVILKPVLEGSSKGVSQGNVVYDEPSMRIRAKELIDRYRQGVMAEEFLPGREFTVAVLGERRPRVLPPMEIVFNDKSQKNPVYTYENKLEPNKFISYEVPAKIDAALLGKLERAAKKSFIALGCRDFGRIDFRLDSRGEPHFVECNPLPGLTPIWSDICMIANAAGMDYRSLIGEILDPAIRRFKEKNRHLMIARRTPSPDVETQYPLPAA